MRICILGNSTALKMRPPRERSDERTFGERLRDAGHAVRFSCQAGVLLSEQFATLDDSVVAEFPDALVVVHGIIEIYPRRTFRWANNAAIRNYYLNDRLGRRFDAGGTFSRLIDLFLRVTNGLTRRLAALLRVQWRWQSTGLYMQVLQACCDRVLKETSAHVYVLGVPSMSGRGVPDPKEFLEGVRLHNVRLKELCDGRPDRVHYVDTDAALAELSQAEALPDGIHFSAAGHARVFETLARILPVPGV